MDTLARQRDQHTLFVVIVGMSLAFVVFGFLADPPGAVLRGIGDIVVARDLMITDFVGVGGLGGAFVHAGVVTLVACAVYRITGAPVDGAAVSCLLLVLGTALYGKTLLNIWPIVAGVALYAWVRGDRLADHVSTAFFATALSPIFSVLAFGTALPAWAGLPLAVGTSVLIGFVVPPVARRLFDAHAGFTLYNMGFVAGVVGAVVVSVYRAFGLAPQPEMVWTSGHDTPLLILLGLILLGLLAAAFVRDRAPWRHYGALLRRDGRAPSDFLDSDGAAAVLLNMAVIGALATGYVLVIGAHLNGPVVAGILSVIGFGACGKHALNIVPIVVGVALAGLLKPFELTDPGLIWAALYGTCLAPIAGRFGPHWGVVAGFFHASTAQVTGAVVAGLNLYGNGFAAGFVAAVVAPVAAFLSHPRRDTATEDEPVPAA
ncbi:DUF1576 domain-containing protein [Nocardia neocaledoniensis]|uniref:DUF1576 domain-containing protein n=1 Tax=Nocardia neocaledoniensis TaxID=236511 RepID=UPI002454469A|nr:DUF1576 domain-containing protein [Nocardia neocaledoniensis]